MATIRNLRKRFWWSCPGCTRKRYVSLTGPESRITGNGADLDHKAGHRHLGAAVGSASFVEAYLDAKVASWVAQVERLSDVAATQPHAAYAAFVFGLRHRWTFVQRTMPTAQEHMEPLQAAIRQSLVPALIHHQPSDLDMELLTLPASLRGMSFDDLIAESPRKNADSIKCTARLTRLICAQMENSTCHPLLSLDQLRRPKFASVTRSKLLQQRKHLKNAYHNLSAVAMEVARLKGASSILTTLPIAEHGFYFECKSDFFDMVHLQYCWPITNLPSTCPCGAQYSLNHSQICKLAGFVKHAPRWCHWLSGKVCEGGPQRRGSGTAAVVTHRWNLSPSLRQPATRRSCWPPSAGLLVR